MTARPGLVGRGDQWLQLERALGRSAAGRFGCALLVGGRGTGRRRRPVPPGTRADEVYLTNLVNHALPLIRYELTDQIELLDDPSPCPCGSTHRRIADPYGRLDDVFTYGAVAVHPHVFRSPLSRRREVVGYRVRQTPDGAAVAVRATGPLDTAGLAADIAAGLAGLGVPEPRVDVEVTDRLPRAASGKLARFERLA